MLLISNKNSGCKLLGSSFENSIQLLLGLFAFGSLILKWQCEKKDNRRELKTFLLDGLKQGISSLIAHGANMLLAMGLSSIVLDTDQCAWYLVSYLMDTLLGVGLAYLLLRYLTYLANKYNWITIKESGYYGDDNSNKSIFKYWSAQLFTWILIILISRIFTGLVLFIFKNGFANVADGIASLFTGNPKLLLLFVMIICPGIMNLVQVWIQDNILKKNIESSSTLDIQLLDNDGIGNDSL